MSSFNYEKSDIINWFKDLDNAWDKWKASIVQNLFWYEDDLTDFINLIKKSEEICHMKWVKTKNHFSWNISNLEEYYLSKYSCYLISIFADLSKTNVTYAKMFFELEVKEMYI